MFVSQKVEELISEKTGLETDKIKPESHLQKDLNISQSELIDFLTSLEEYFKVVIKREDVQRLETVADLENLIKDLTNDI